MQAFVRTQFLPSLDKHQGVQLLDHIVRVGLILLGTDKLSSDMAGPFRIPTSSE